MLAARLVGNIWVTRKINSLNGLKFMLAEVIDNQEEKQRLIVADTIGAGIGDRVIICTGSSAKLIFEERAMPVDATVIGIIDEDCHF